VVGIVDGTPVGLYQRPAYRWRLTYLLIVCFIIFICSQNHSFSLLQGKLSQIFLVCVVCVCDLFCWKYLSIPQVSWKFEFIFLLLLL
jgi:hypothetical protein